MAEKKQIEQTKEFHLRTILTVITGRLLTISKGPNDNGIGDLYQLLGWMTNDSPFTHQLGRFSEECKPWLLRWFPELKNCFSLKSLNEWLSKVRDNSDEGIKMWIAELRMMFPIIKETYQVPHIPRDDHDYRNPIEELKEMTNAEIIIVNPEAEKP